MAGWFCGVSDNRGEYRTDISGHEAWVVSPAGAYFDPVGGDTHILHPASKNQAYSGVI